MKENGTGAGGTIVGISKGTWNDYNSLAVIHDLTENAKTNHQIL